MRFYQYDDGLSAYIQIPNERARHVERGRLEAVRKETAERQQLGRVVEERVMDKLAVEEPHISDLMGV